MTTWIIEFLFIGLFPFRRRWFCNKRVINYLCYLIIFICSSFLSNHIVSHIISTLYVTYYSWLNIIKLVSEKATYSGWVSSILFKMDNVKERGPINLHQLLMETIMTIGRLAWKLFLSSWATSFGKQSYMDGLHQILQPKTTFNLWILKKSKQLLKMKLHLGSLFLLIPYVTESIKISSGLLIPALVRRRFGRLFKLLKKVRPNFVCQTSTSYHIIWKPKDAWG